MCHTSLGLSSLTHSCLTRFFSLFLLSFLLCEGRREIAPLLLPLPPSFFPSYARSPNHAHIYTPAEAKKEEEKSKEQKLLLLFSLLFLLFLFILRLSDAQRKEGKREKLFSFFLFSLSSSYFAYKKVFFFFLLFLLPLPKNSDTRPKQLLLFPFFPSFFAIFRPTLTPAGRGRRRGPPLPFPLFLSPWLGTTGERTHFFATTVFSLSQGRGEGRQREHFFLFLLLLRPWAQENVDRVGKEVGG